MAGGSASRACIRLRPTGKLVLAGEVDWFNETVLLSVVHAAARTLAMSSAAETLRVDLRRVTSLSVGGCRAVAVGTHRFRDRGGHLQLVAPSRSLSGFFSCVDWMG